MIDANAVLRHMERAGARLNLLILDACRNKSFCGWFCCRFGGAGYRATNRPKNVFARVATSWWRARRMIAPPGTLIAYATQPGSAALDGRDGNSPSTKALAETIKRPGLDVFSAFNEVGSRVSSATGGVQQPWIAASPIPG